MAQISILRCDSCGEEFDREMINLDYLKYKPAHIPGKGVEYIARDACRACTKKLDDILDKFFKKKMEVNMISDGGKE